MSGASAVWQRRQVPPWNNVWCRAILRGGKDQPYFFGEILLTVHNRKPCQAKTKSVPGFSNEAGYGSVFYLQGMAKHTSAASHCICSGLEFQSEWHGNSENNCIDSLYVIHFSVLFFFFSHSGIQTIHVLVGIWNIPCYLRQSNRAKTKWWNTLVYGRRDPSRIESIRMMTACKHTPSGTSLWCAEY